MNTINLLDFLNISKDLYTLDYATCDSSLVNFLDIISVDEQFTQKIDLGMIYIDQKTSEQFMIVDGLRRILSLSLLLHAICECYKKTTQKNEKAIKTIRTKYLLNGSKTKLRLPDSEQNIYNKIIFGERLNGREKESAMFRLLHSFWSQIKENNLIASDIFKMLKKICVVFVDVDNVPLREIYFTVNKNHRNIEQLDLISNYLKNIGILNEWIEFENLFNNNSYDIKLFFKDFFITKFNFIEFDYNNLYSNFVNYFETMLQYMSEDVIIEKIHSSARLYLDILNVNFTNENIRKAMIQIKMFHGEDTYAYLLNIYEDFMSESITEATFLEILSTINEYLKNRSKTPNSVCFNELIQYLNAFIACK